MKRFLKEYFSFSYSELRVVLILSFMILLTLVLRMKVAKMELTPEPVPEEMITEVEEFIASMKEIDSSESNGYVYSKTKTEIFPLFLFDPNKSDDITLKKLGFEDRTVRNIIKYREAGGTFHKAEDMKKIYGMNEKFFMSVKDYIIIDSSIFKSDEDRKPLKWKLNGEGDVAQISADSISTESSATIQSFDINSATASDLLAINGIGKVFSERIVKYRDLLGGYYTIDQLTEVYGVTDSMVILWKGSLYADSGRINYISVNFSEYKQLLRHPYLDKKQVDGIMRFRTFCKNQFNPVELLSNGILPDSCFNRIKAYLIH